MQYLWLLLCYVNFAKSSSFIDEYEQLTKKFLCPKRDKMVVLPIYLGEEKSSGCLCRASEDRSAVVCFGNYACKRFPKVMIESEILRVRTTAIEAIYEGDLDAFYFLEILEIDANHILSFIEPGVFRNMTKLTFLSISYNTALHSIRKEIFFGLINLRNLTVINNGFTNILDITSALSVTTLPLLTGLDLSENFFDVIPQNAFAPMKGSQLRRLDLSLCRLDYINKNSLMYFQKLKYLNIGDNDLNVTLISQLLTSLKESKINLTRLDLSGMGFRKKVPTKILNIIAEMPVKILLLARNQFETIHEESFPSMKNIEILDLRRVFAISIGVNSFNPNKFPQLKVLLLSGNNLPGLHKENISEQQMQLLDLSKNEGSFGNFEIGKYTFNQSTQLRILNLSYNRIKSILNYTFVGLHKLEMLNLQNGTIYYIGPETFKPLKNLQVLNLSNNPLVVSHNLTSDMFKGLNSVRYLTLENCGIKHFNDDDNIFEMFPNLSNLILKNNQLLYITAELLKPLKLLDVLDLSENLLISWWQPLFLNSGVKPKVLYLTNNKISHFSVSMIQDINYLMESNTNSTAVIDLMNNVFICDCNSMYRTYLWLQVNESTILKNYFAQSKFLCSRPDLWEDRTVADYLSSMKSFQCLLHEKLSTVTVLVWTAPTVVTIMLVAIIFIIIYKYRVYLRYWIFLGKIALGRKLNRKLDHNKNPRGFKYDAFLSYSNEDRNFVLEMIAKLEQSPPYLKLCVFERDFEIGSFISESIHKSINESKYVVLIISNSFAKSQWCRWETQLAEYHRIFLDDDLSYDPLVLIRIGNIDSKYLTTTLKYLMKTKIYQSWDENSSDEFWNKLRHTLHKDN